MVCSIVRLTFFFLKKKKKGIPGSSNLSDSSILVLQMLSASWCDRAALKLELVIRMDFQG